MSKFEALVDSAAWIAIYMPDDLFHRDALMIYEGLKAQNRKMVTTSAVLGETVTVLSHRAGQELARSFLSFIQRSEIPVIFIDEDMHQQALALFRQQEKKGTSFVDCANAVVARRLGIATVFSFDDFYVKKMGLKAA